MKICILGSTGMLGSVVGKYFLEKYGEDDVFLSYRNKDVSYGKNRFYYDPMDNDFLEVYNYYEYGDSFRFIEICDIVLLCAGIIKPFSEKNIKETIYVNSIFPHVLADACEKQDKKLIHITSDCVFTGKKGKYTENDLHDCTDIYGKTKSLGEPKNCMVLRTSIIGEEIHKNASLVEWAKSQKGKTINGFTNHLWNGVTTKQFAKICDQIIQKDLYKKELSHVFSNIVTKYWLLKMLNNRFDLNLTINTVDAKDSVDRSMSTVKDLQSKLDIPGLEQQIAEM